MITLLRSATISEPELLILLGGGLVVLATLVRRVFGNCVPKTHRLIVWIAPKEIAEYFICDDSAMATQPKSMRPLQ